MSEFILKLSVITVKSIVPVLILVEYLELKLPG